MRMQVKLLVLCILLILIVASIAIFAAKTGMISGKTCRITGAYPDSSCTPGDVFSVTKEQICVPGYSKSVRNVDEHTKDFIYKSYGITTHEPYQYEIDHQIPLELGGSNEISNLWPEPAEPFPGYHEKDRVENYLHDQVCRHGMSLSEAQQLINKNWTQVYANITA